MQAKRKDIILSVGGSFMKPKLLIFAVVVAILFVAIGASMSSTQSAVEGVYKYWF